MTKIIELILTTDKVWLWWEWDPVRSNVELWTKKWKLVATKDVVTGKIVFNGDVLFD